MKINKIIFTCICLMTIFSSCISYHGQLDTSVPMIEQITLITPAGLDIVNINGINVDISTIGLAILGSNSIRLPPGEHSIEFRYRAETYPVREGNKQISYYITGKPSLTYDFEPGYQYYAYVYTNALGRELDPETAVIFGLLGGLNIAIVKMEKEQSNTYITYDSGMSLALSKGPVNLIGFFYDICPLGVIIDTGKVAYGFNANLGIRGGYRPDGIDFPIDFELFYGGMANLYFNRNNGKAFGFGLGGGFVQSMFSLFDSGMQTLSYYPNPGSSFENFDIYIPEGVWYLRGAVIFERSKKFSLYFDYYLKNLYDEIPDYNWLNAEKLKAHPRNWASWGIGLTYKFL